MVVFVVVALGFLTLGVAAWAYFTSLGSGSGQVAVGSLTPTSAVTATFPSSGVRMVNVTWAGTAAPDGGPVDGYFVQRFLGSTPSPACGSSPTSLLSATAVACNDTDVASGTYTYRVTAVHRTWTASSAASGPVTVPASAFSSFAVPAPNTVTSGTPFNVTIVALDQYGTTFVPYTGAKCVTFANPSNSPNGAAPTYPPVGSCGTGSSVTFSSGVAAAGVTLVNAQTTTLKVTDNPTGTAGTSASITVLPATANRVGFVQQPTTTTAGSAVAPAPTVQVRDQFGNSVSGAGRSLSMAVASGPGPFSLSSTTTVTTDAGGLATFSNLVLNIAGTYTLQATSTGLSATTSTSFNVMVGPARKLAFTTQPSGATGTGVTSGVFPIQPAVTVQDAGGNTVTGYVGPPITLTIGTNPSGASLTCTTNPAVPVLGVATYAGCRLSATGNGYTLVATSGSLTPATSDPFNVTGVATKLVYTTQPGGGTAATAWAQQPVVVAQDASGNLVTAYPASNVALAITTGTGGSGAALTCDQASNTTATSYGRAAFSGCRIDKAATSYTLTATSGGLTAATSAPFAISVGPAVRLTFYQSPSSGSLAGSAFDAQPIVLIQDAGANLVTTYTTPITLAVTSGTGSAGASLACTANPVTPASGNGYAVFNGCSIDQWGSGYTLTATSGSLVGISAAFDVYQFTPSLQLVNNGVTAGKAEPGDTIVITYPNPIAPATFCGGWNGSATLIQVTVSFTNTGGNSITGMTDAAECAAGTGFNSGSTGIGTINMAATNYFSSAGSFTGGTATWNATTNALTITLGTLSSGTVTTGTNTTATYTAHGSLSVPTTISTSRSRQF